MAEYISRETMIKLLQRMADYAEANGFYYDREVIEFVAATLAGIPAADVAPVVHGHWIRQDESFTRYKCSNPECGVEDFSGFENYCPNCGVKMDEEE